MDALPFDIGDADHQRLFGLPEMRLHGDDLADNDYVVDLLFNMPRPPNPMDVKSEVPSSWFESSVEDLLETIQPSLNGVRVNVESDCHAQGVSPLHGSDMTNHKRPKVIGFSSTHGQRHSVGASHEQGQSSFSSDRGFQGETSSSAFCSQQYDQQSSNPGGANDEEGTGRSNGDEEDGSHGMEDDAPSMYLTDDLLHMVFSFLEQRSLCKAAMVCRQWRVASGHEEFWKSLQFGRNATLQQVGSLCRRFPRALDLAFNHVEFVDAVAREAMLSLRCLEKMSVSKGCLSDAFFKALTTSCPALQYLNIVDAVLGNVGSPQEILISHRNLCRLKVTECRVMRVAIRCPRLVKLSLKQTNMTAAILQCPRLLSLDVSSCHKLSDAGVRAAASSCRSLVALNISQCSYVSDETLREVCLACTGLQVLDASWCTNLSFQGVNMPMLRELRLNNCEGINSSSMAALSQCFMLETIQLDYCTLLTAVVLDLQRLQNISLSNCCKFVDLTLRCPSLVNINITECIALNRIDISSVALKRLALQKQQSLTMVSLQCPYLQSVDFTECESLVDSVCDVFSQGGGCPRLNTLILDSCESLTMVKLSSCNLQHLSLAGCRNVVSIDISCVNLQELYLDGCDHLSIATFVPVGLQSLNLGICPRVQELKIEALSMTSLELKGCGVLSRASINCPQLVSLDASYCSAMDDGCLEAATASCPLVQMLVLACCPSIGSTGLLSLKRLSCLTTLDLSYTFLTDLTPIFQTSPRLKVLRLLACKYLADSALDSLHWKSSLPDLRELDLSYGSLGQAALEGLLSQCSHLMHISLNGCANLHDLDWEKQSCNYEGLSNSFAGSDGLGRSSFMPLRVSDFQSNEMLKTDIDAFGGVEFAGHPTRFPSYLMDEDFVAEKKIISPYSLRQLNCVGCPNIKRVAIPETAGFNDLSVLNFSLSSNIKEVRLECSYLTLLNLSHCTALEKLDLRCPRLLNLSLQDSMIEGTALGIALQKCLVLETLDVRNCSKVSVEDLNFIRSACPRLKRLVSTISA